MGSRSDRVHNVVQSKRRCGELHSSTQCHREQTNSDTISHSKERPTRWISSDLDSENIHIQESTSHFTDPNSQRRHNYKTKLDLTKKKEIHKKKMRRPQLKTVYRREPRLGGMSARQSEAASFISATNGHNCH